MKKLLLTFGIFLAGIAFVNAQDKAAAATTKMVDHITQVCNLTPDQVTKVQPMIASFVKTREANKQQYAGDKAGMQSANKTNRQNLKAQLQTVLTADQQAKLKADNAQRKSTSNPSVQGGEEQ